MTQKDNPEIGHRVVADGIQTNYLEAGTASGTPLVLLHGSGPGVTAWANWRLAIPELAKTRRVLAPDAAGFGYTERKAGTVYGLDLWVRHIVGFLDALGIGQADLVGNSFGGALTLAVAAPPRACAQDRAHGLGRYRFHAHARTRRCVGLRALGREHENYRGDLRLRQVAADRGIGSLALRGQHTPRFS